MKEKYNRYNVNSELLKRVIIRIDYQGMTAVDSWVTQLKNHNFGNFQRYSRTYLSSSQVRNYRIGEVMDSLNLPDQAIFNEPLHSFSDIALGGHEDMVRMDVSNYFTIIIIDCKNYTNIDDYFMDGSRIIYSLVIDSCSYQATNKTFDILTQYGLNEQKLNMLCWSHPDLDHTLRMNDLITHYCNNRTKILTPLGIVNSSFTVIDRNRGDDAIFSLIRRLNNSKKYVQKTVCVDDGHDKFYGFWLLTNDGEFEVEINALSPMDSYVNHFITNKKTTKKNHVSIVLQLKMPGDYNFLFCSDAEDTILDSIKEEPFVDPLFVKIPHHGSNSSEGIFTYSLEEQRDSYFLKQIENETGLSSNLLSHIIKPADFKIMSIRKVVHAIENTAYSVISISTGNNNEGKSILLHTGILKLIAILRKLDVSDTDIIVRLKRAIETKGITDTGLFMHLAPFINLAAYKNVRGDIRFTGSTDKSNTFHVDDILDDGRAHCSYSTSLNHDEKADQRLTDLLKKVLLMVAK